jgi:hemerythrin
MKDYEITDKNILKKIAKGRIKICDCREVAEYNEKYDSQYCKECKKWLESHCDNIDCGICSQRPNKP